MMNVPIQPPPAVASSDVDCRWPAESMGRWQEARAPLRRQPVGAVDGIMLGAAVSSIHAVTA
jgi:hypothetical protein